MFDLPVVLVKGQKSNLDFFDDVLIKFTNCLVYSGAVNALQALEDAPANVVIMETDVDEMTGIELAEAIRDIDEDRNHFTYIILIGAINPEPVSYTHSDAADEEDSVDLGGRRIIKKKKTP